MTSPEAERQPGDPPAEMTRLYLGLLEKGPTWTAEATPEIRANQRAHLALLSRLSDEGPLLLAGPIPEGERLRGILICQAESNEEARGYFEGDAHIQSGRLTLALHPWLVPTASLEEALLDKLRSFSK